MNLTWERILPSVTIELRGGYLLSRAPWASPKSVLAAASPNKAIVATETTASAALSTVIPRRASNRNPLIFRRLLVHLVDSARTGRSRPSLQRYGSATGQESSSARFIVRKPEIVDVLRGWLLHLFHRSSTSVHRPSQNRKNDKHASVLAGKLSPSFC